MSANATVLYDAPGPKARRRNAIIAVVFIAILVAVAAYVIYVLAGNDQLTADKWNPFIKSTTWTTYILPGLWGTLKAAALSIVFALIFGAVLGIGRLSDHTWVRAVSGLIVEVFRAIPVLILMIFAYYLFADYAIFPSSQLAFAAVVTGLTLYNGSVIAEIIRSGINSLPKGQTEASQALGLRKSQMMRVILLPQAVTAMLPALISQMVIALKDSALGYAIGYVEVVRSGIQSASYYGNYLPALVVVAIVMILINFGLSSFATYLEARLRGGRRKTAVADHEEADQAAAENMPTFGKK
ncbi:amino acid ABC transporter permease [Gordonia sp. NPDC062954]|jgi:glutamate transport system permease protein|uniref:Amino acid ABC transporter permease n=1 Tax=Gordonia aquimaris TaxID=2984863 RepID=A0A9X3D618_9ACTN|nr:MULTISPECIES: amino acid ABC transporter permease [Gordonia]MAU82892.1 glutamate ABC transporter permease [Gordonia sp. (in: high G+C Gram-positive bacteria)]MCX2965440.1 amino acid ABC transporter permease [Gordonia aquimaris]